MKNRILMYLPFILLMACSSGSHSAGHKDTPIDCPLKKQGIDPHKMRPFAEVKKYIEFLDREDRAVWQKPDVVVRSMDLKGTESIADIGAGSGYFSFRFAPALPRGKVIAIDIEPEMLRHIHHTAKSSGIKNIEVSVAAHDDPIVPEYVDIVFVCDVLHHVGNRLEWLTRLNREMRKGAKLILIEFKEGRLPEGPPEKMKIPGRMILSLVRDAGFTLVKRDTKLLPYQDYYEFVK